MSENKIQKTIIECLEKAGKTDSITSEKVYEIFRDTMYDVVTENTEKAEELKPIVKEAVMTAAKSFQDDKKVDREKEKENLTSAVKGIMAGIKQCRDKRIDDLKRKIIDLESKIKLENKELSILFEQGMEGAKEAEDLLLGDSKKIVESVLSNIRIKTATASGVNVQSIKDAVKQAVESGGNIKEAVVNITRDATKKALKKGSLKAGIVKETTEKILSGAVDAAEETGQDIKDITSGAFKGIQEGIASMAHTITDTTEKFVHEDLNETKEDLKAIKTLFLETVLKVGKHSGKIARQVLDDLADQSRAAGTVFKDETGSAADKLSERLKNLGKEAVKTFGNTGEKAARMVTDEVKDIGKKSINVAKGSITGMWKGAKEALEKKDGE